MPRFQACGCSARHPSHPDPVGSTWVLMPSQCKGSVADTRTVTPHISFSPIPSHHLPRFQSILRNAGFGSLEKEVGSLDFCSGDGQGGDGARPPCSLIIPCPSASQRDRGVRARGCSGPPCAHGAGKGPDAAPVSRGVLPRGCAAPPSPVTSTSGFPKDSPASRPLNQSRSSSFNLFVFFFHILLGCLCC